MRRKSAGSHFSLCYLQLQPLETDDRFTVECNEGYELVGPGGPLVCYKDDIYSRNLPACQMKDLNVTECFRPFVQNAKIVGSSLTGYYVTVSIKYYNSK